MIWDFIGRRFHGPPIPADQGLCGFNKGLSLVVKSRLKSMAISSVSKFPRTILYY